MTNETLLMWTAVTVYAAGSVSLAFGTAFRKESLLRWGLWIAIAGLVPHTLAIGIRWARTGHGPYLGFYEVVSSFAWAAVFVLGVISARNAKLRNLGVIIVPIAFILLAAAMFTPSADLEVTGKLASWWLTIHVAFAKLTYASFTASFALALAYLVRDSKRRGALREVLDKLPRQEVLDDLSFRFVSVGFIFLFVMIAAGAVWANEAWGRYWGWDPIETWSAISWVVYAVYLHLRLTMGWKGRKASIYAVAALPVVLFALIGVPVVYQSIHGAYLMGY